jgi:NADH:ubiquinone oxidoreductase subunit 4 (subunit M)
MYTAVFIHSYELTDARSHHYVIIILYFSLFYGMEKFVLYIGIIYWDYISYGLILLRFWVCVLIIMARESIFRSVYYPGLFLGFVVLLLIMLFCTFTRINLFSFYLIFESSLTPTVFFILG